MDKTPKPTKKNKLTCRRLSRTSSSNTNLQPSTSKADEDDALSLFSCTQELPEDVEVVWDWNSPQANVHKRLQQKRVNQTHSPKNPIKRHPSNTQIQNFDKVREELQALREQMAIPDNEESLILSPLDEAFYKNMACSSDVEVEPCFTDFTQKSFNNDVEDLFNDSLDEQLLECTQNIERALHESPKEAEQKITNTSLDKDKKEIESAVKNENNNRIDFADDSFDVMMANVNTDHVFESNVGLAKVDVQYNSVETSTGKMEFNRTQSFDLATSQSEILTKSKLEEIERNRKEAIARLNSRKKQNNVSTPSQCSPAEAAEIERKRLQALERLKANRLEEVIEMKRKEALKRLELSRKRNASVIKRL